MANADHNAVGKLVERTDLVSAHGFRLPAATRRSTNPRLALVSWIPLAIMNSLKVAKKRFRRTNNMIMESRRGLTYARSGLSRSILPTESRGERSELEAYVDAHDTGPGIWKWQHYLPIFERHFAKFKDNDVHVVEIGIYSGGSLDMWKKYFGERCHIHGIDISRSDCRSYASPGVDIHIGDQADPSFWEDFVNKVPQVDIVIDDGGHLTIQQRATLEGLQLFARVACTSAKTSLRKTTPSSTISSGSQEGCIRSSNHRLPSSKPSTPSTSTHMSA